MTVDRRPQPVGERGGEREQVVGRAVFDQARARLAARRLAQRHVGAQTNAARRRGRQVRAGHHQIGAQERSRRLQRRVVERHRSRERGQVARELGDALAGDHAHAAVDGELARDQLGQRETDPVALALVAEVA